MAEHSFRLDLGMDCVYNNTMKPIFTTVILALALSGCAVTTGVNVASYVVTGRGTTDHATSYITGSDCDGVRTITHGTWYCETRDIGKTYNRTGY